MTPKEQFREWLRYHRYQDDEAEAIAAKAAATFAGSGDGFPSVKRIGCGYDPSTGKLDYYRIQIEGLNAITICRPEGDKGKWFSEGKSIGEMVADAMPTTPPAAEGPMVGAAGLTTFPFDGYGRGGISERDYFAAAALQGMSRGSLIADVEKLPNGKTLTQLRAPIDESTIANWCYQLADAMLKERDRNT